MPFLNNNGTISEQKPQPNYEEMAKKYLLYDGLEKRKFLINILSVFACLYFFYYF
jgi:hypothetical protein